MQLDSHIQAIQQELVATGALGDEAAAEAARRISEALASTLHLHLLDILGEAALIGLVSGLAGMGVALLAGLGFDVVVPQFLPELPFQPDSLFSFDWWILGGGLAFSVVFCILGGFLPAGNLN